MNWSRDDEALQEKLASVVHFFDLGSLLSRSRAGGYANKNYFVDSVTFLVQFGVYYPDEQLKASYAFYWQLGLDQWKLDRR